MNIPPIAVVGSIIMDVAVWVNALPQPGETVLGGDALTSLGGKGANQAIAAKRLGADVTMIGLVGSDAFGVAALSTLQEEGLSSAGIGTFDKAATGIGLITIGSAGQNMITVSPGANAKVSATYVLSHAPALKASKLMLLQNEIPREAVQAALQVARNSGVSIVLDPAPAQGFDQGFLAAADYLTPNETEAAQLTGLVVNGRESGLAAARLLVERGVRHALVKLGAGGVVFAGAAGEGHVPAPSVKAIDTVAAGDCFNGALAVALGEGLALPDALSFACRAAAISVTRTGASRSMPMRRELM